MMREEEKTDCVNTVLNKVEETPTLREVFLAQPLNPLVPLVFNVVPTRKCVVSAAQVPMVVLSNDATYRP